MRSRIFDGSSCPGLPVLGLPALGRPGVGRVAPPGGSLRKSRSSPWLGRRPGVGRESGRLGLGRLGLGRVGRLGLGRLGRPGVGRLGDGRLGLGRVDGLDGVGRVGRGVGREGRGVGCRVGMRLIEGERLTGGRPRLTPPPPRLTPPPRPPRPRWAEPSCGKQSDSDSHSASATRSRLDFISPSPCLLVPVARCFPARGQLVHHRLVAFARR